MVKPTFILPKSLIISPDDFENMVSGIAGICKNILKFQKKRGLPLLVHLLQTSKVLIRTINTWLYIIVIFSTPPSPYTFTTTAPPVQFRVTVANLLQITNQVLLTAINYSCLCQTKLVVRLLCKRKPNITSINADAIRGTL